MAIPIPTVTGYSAFWQTTGDSLPYAMTPTANGGGRSPIESKLARLLARNQLRTLTALWAGLTGAASGSNVTATYKRVQSPTGPDATVPVVTDITALGGARTIETVTEINRNTTAADVAYLKDILDGDLLERTISYPTVLGSGGGGKLVNGVNTF